MTVMDYNVRATEARHRNPDAYDRPGGRLGTFVVTADRELLATDWIERVLNDAVELLELPREWDGPRSRIIEPRVIEMLIVDVLPKIMPPGRNAVAPQLVPTREGGVQVEWHRGGWDVEIELSPYRRSWVDCERADGTDMWSGTLSDNLDPLRVVLKEIADR
jgi:hypothetical protein